MIGDFALACPHCGEQPGARAFAKLLVFFFKLMGALVSLLIFFLVLDSVLGDNSTRDSIILVLMLGGYLFARFRRWRTARAKKKLSSAAPASM